MKRHEDLSSLLSSNIVPSSFAAQLIQAEVDDLTRQITRLHSQLQELEEAVRKRRIVLSPLRRMPPETLGEIFSFALPEILDVDGRRRIVDLMLVSKTWHRATLATHRLWGGLQIRETGGGIPSFKNIVSWFSRSGDCPKILDIGDHWCCFVNSEYHDDDVPSVECILLEYPLAQLLAEGPSLDRLSITFVTQRCFKNVLDSLQFHTVQSQIRPWDSVRSLELHFSPYSGSWYEPPDPSDTIFLRLPSTVTSFLLDFSSSEGFQGTVEEIARRTIPLPPTFLQRLTSFHLTCLWGGDRILAILQDCVNLESLTIDFEGDFVPIPPHLRCDDIRLPKLQTLNLERVPTDVEILDFLVAPALVNLDITFGEADDGLETGDLYRARKFLLASNRKNTILRSLRIRCASIGADNFTQLLHSLPSLTHLTLENVTFDGSPFQIATYSTPATPYLPQLEVLELLNTSEGSPSCNLMADFLVGGRSEQRLPVPRLKQLTMSHKSATSGIHDCLPKFKRLEKSGVSINITPPSTWSYQSL